MGDDYFKVIRGGLNSTFQDEGREGLAYHLAELWIKEII